MKRPLFVLLIGLALGEAVAASIEWKGVVLPVFLVLMLGVMYLLHRRKENRFFVVFVFMICSFTGGYILILTQLHEDAFDWMLAQDSQDGTLEGTIDQLTTSSDGTYQIVLKTCTCSTDDGEWKLKGMCRVSGITADGNLYPGLLISCYGSVSAYENSTNPGGFNSKIYYASRGIFYSGYASSYKILSAPAHSLRRYLYLFREHIKEVYNTLLSEEEAGLLEAIVLGDKSNLSEETRTLYEENGVAHLLAVSGLHVSIIGGSVFRMLRKKKVPYSLSCACGSLILILYGLMTGFGSSVMRAVCMYIFYLVAEWIGADYDMISAMGLSGLLMLMEYPWRIEESGFQISFLSILAIGGVIPFMTELLNKKQSAILSEGELPSKAYQIFKRYLFSGFVLSAVTMPVLLYYYYEWSPYSILLNLVLIPLMSPVMVSGLAGGLLGLLGQISGAGSASILHSGVPGVASIIPSGVPGAAGIIPSGISGVASIIPSGIPRLTSIIPSGISGVAGIIPSGIPRLVGIIPSGIPGLVGILPARVLIWLYRVILKGVRHLPFSLIVTGCPGIYGLLLIYIAEIATVFLWYIYQSRYRKQYILGGLAFLSALLLLWPERQLGITMLDIGQGECILIRLPDGESMLVDGGSTSKSNTAKYVIKPALKYYGISKLDYVVITHVDEDHISGLEELFEAGYPIDTVIVSDLAELDGTAVKVRQEAEDDGCLVQSFQRGDSISLKQGKHDITFTCLHPTHLYETEDRNDGCVVLYLKYDNFDMLFTGDIGEEGESVILKYLKAHKKTYRSEGLIDGLDILKVAHHGSMYSTSDEWLDLLNPHTAILSCGRNNRYGHPHAALLSRLSTRKIPVYRTDEEGAIMIKTNGKSYQIRTYIN